MFDNPIIFYGLIFAAAILLVDTVLRAIFSIRRSRDEVANRLEEIKKKAGAEEAYGELLKRRGLGGRGGQQSIGTLINRYMAQTGMEITVATQILYFIMLTLLGFLLSLFLFGFSLTTSYFTAPLLGILFCILIVYWLRSRRITQFTKQLSPAIDVIVRSLNAGHPLTTAIGLVAREMPDPVGSEFGILNDQMTFGSELEQAMMNMYERVGAPELNLLTVTVSVQRGTGGNLAEILENLSQMIRDRLMIKNKIKAISAEGRITAWIMLIFPFALFYMIKFLVPTYYDLVWESGYGTTIVSICLIMVFLGMLVIRRLINFDF